MVSENNKAPRRKRRGIKYALQTAGFQPACAPRGEELNPKRLKEMWCNTAAKFIRYKFIDVVQSRFIVE
jgi:hypothetical protein